MSSAHDEQPATAEEAKAQGGAAFVAGEYKKAAALYSKAIELSGSKPDHTLFSNRSGAHASARQYGEALSDAEECIRLKADFAKGYSRKGYALAAQGKFTAAIQAYKQGLGVDPENRSMLESLEKVKEQQASWIRHTSRPNAPKAKPPTWLVSLQAPLRGMVFINGVFYAANPANQDKYLTFMYCAAFSFLVGALPDATSKNWQALMQGLSTHYFFCSLIFSFCVPPFLPGAMLLLLVNVPLFFEDIVLQLEGSDYASRVRQISKAALWRELISGIEITVGLMSILVFWQGTQVYLPIFYWQWLRMRCMLGVDACSGFRRIDHVLMSTLGQVPVLGLIYGAFSKALSETSRMPDPGEKSKFVPKGCTVM